MSIKRPTSNRLSHVINKKESLSKQRKILVKTTNTEKPKLLSGGNPQIPKGEGDIPVQAYIKAMPGWKRDIGKSIDKLIVLTVPNVRKAVKWNSPFYGVEGKGWFLNFHCFNKYVKIAFFQGSSLHPIPPGESKDENVRYFDIYENDKVDESQLCTWIRQAAKLPGWNI